MTPTAAVVMAVYYVLSTGFPIALVLAIYRHLPRSDR